MEPEVEEVAGPSARDRTIPFTRWVLAASLLSLNFIDVWVTRLILDRGGMEANPVMRPIIHDPAAPLFVKLAVASLVGVLLLASPRESKFPDRAMAVTVMIYAVVIAWNAGVLLQTVDSVG